MLIEILHRVEIPDPVRVERYRRIPEWGPRILFFSGGTALRDVSRELIGYTHNSIHIICSFDSGGSSAKLREAFGMPAIGDIRNRLMALADRSLQGNPEIYHLFQHRFPEAAKKDLRKKLNEMIEGKHPFIECITDPMRKIIRRHLEHFRKHMPEDFDLKKASIGNLILAGGYLENNRHLDPVIFIFSNLLKVRGTVRPIVNRDLHLVAETESGKIIVGQHRITGKETAPLGEKIKAVHLASDKADPLPVEVEIRRKMKDLIGEAELICYPMGSFYSSVLSNLLPKGVGRAIVQNGCPKIFIPNTGHDPELESRPISEQVDQLVALVKKDLPAPVSNDRIINFVLLDSTDNQYKGKVNEKDIEQKGVKVIRSRLIDGNSRPDISAGLLVPVLLSFI